MTETEVDPQIRRYCAILEITFGESPDSFLRLHPDFRDAVAGWPFPAAASLHGLKPDTVEELLPSLYRRQPKYPAATMEWDGDAAYNDHHEITGYKPDTIDDIDHGVPVAMKTVPANVGDAPLLQEQVRSCMNQSGMRCLWMDGGYDSYENTGWLNINGIKPHFHIHENWVPKPACSVEHLQALYGRHWKEHVAAAETDSLRSLQCEHVPDAQPLHSTGCGAQQAATRREGASFIRCISEVTVRVWRYSTQICGERETHLRFKRRGQGIG